MRKVGGGSRGTLTSATVVARLEARRNEDQVLAEAALLGERRVSWARLAMIALFAISSQISKAVGYDVSDSPQRLAVVGCYTALAICSVVILYRRRGSPRKAMFVPLVIAAIDFA